MKRHFYYSVDLLGNAYSACGLFIGRITKFTIKGRLNYTFAPANTTCKNCKRTKVFQNATNKTS